MQSETYINHWQRLHNSFLPDYAKKYKAQIEKVLCCCQSAFYRKLKRPDKFLTIAEKQAICRVYGLAEGYLFPELADLLIC
jgi:hypothetical protein